MHYLMNIKSKKCPIFLTFNSKFNEPESGKQGNLVRGLDLVPEFFLQTKGTNIHLMQIFL